jgi:DNA-binding NarL/FixJ family response regulator
MEQRSLSTDGEMNSIPMVFIAPTPISIVSNSYLLREGLLKLLSESIALQLIAAYTAEPIPTAHLPNPLGHIVLLDSGIGQALSLGWIHYWRALSNSPYVLVLEMSDDAEIILSCIEAGVNGYLLQGATPEEIAQTMQLVRQGQAQCSPQMTAHLFARLAALKSMKTPATSFTMPLTARELQVLNYIGKGYSNKEIALVLYITLRTVKHHVHNILEKLELSHRGDAVRFAVQQGWIDQQPPA